MSGGRVVSYCVLYKAAGPAVMMASDRVINVWLLGADVERHNIDASQTPIGTRRLI